MNVINACSPANSPLSTRSLKSEAKSLILEHFRAVDYANRQISDFKFSSSKTLFRFQTANKKKLKGTNTSKRLKNRTLPVLVANWGIQRGGCRRHGHCNCISSLSSEGKPKRSTMRCSGTSGRDKDKGLWRTDTRFGLAVPRSTSQEPRQDWWRQVTKRKRQ